ncbi:uncharacterized protein LOC109608736 [Aethina tumida]|uniref:uncharacterized protein LOC109608736 n=1 Tax=Aethina tumida TaxID=116153 RepID=UPI00096B189B|nr:uncharacterized protein LOC109608736 [Aethina tumida]
MSVNVQLLFLAIFMLISTGLALNCYQCSGSDPTKPFQCNEWLNNDIDLQPEPCDDVYGAKYCVKHIGRNEGGVGAKRFCSSLDFGNYCNYVKQPGDELQYRTCVFTCSGDGCNPATTITPNKFVYLFMPIAIFMLGFFTR